MSRETKVETNQWDPEKITVSISADKDNSAFSFSVTEEELKEIIQQANVEFTMRQLRVRNRDIEEFKLLVYGKPRHGKTNYGNTDNPALDPKPWVKGLYRYNSPLVYSTVEWSPRVGYEQDINKYPDDVTQ
jgi:hypothetical protein